MTFRLRLRPASYKFAALTVLAVVLGSHWSADAVQRVSHTRLAKQTSALVKPTLSELKQAVARKFDLNSARRMTPNAAFAAILAGFDDRTAVYDISAQTVFLPDGTELEAHSGLGKFADDPRSVAKKNRGVTPPNVYNIALREQPFHGVRALRLTPASDDGMYGRNGILAHTYMLGAQGQSNGCVVFKDYAAFLQAFLSGEVNRLVVVTSVAELPAGIRVADR